MSESTMTYWQKRYRDRKDRGVCIQCQATLQEDDGLRCLECEEGQKLSRAKCQRRTRKRKVRWNAEYRAARRAAQLCTKCPASTDGSRLLCDACSADQALYEKRRRALKKQGVIALSTKAVERSKKQPEPFYRPIDQVLDTPRIRILRALRFMAWPTSSEITEILQVPSLTEDKRTHDVYSSHLSRLVRGGFIERKGERPSCQYRITDKGIAELERAWKVAA